MKSLLVFAILLGLLGHVAADCYMHNPRGSNDRNTEENTNRNNANHLFDSQNNAKGGYCRGPAMYYYEGSLLTVEWTTQHGCGKNPKVWCNVVLQYMCTTNDEALTTRIRDGTGTDTIPDDPAQVIETDANSQPVYAMHESYDYYQECKKRERNMGLFIADRQSEGGLTPGRRDARFTRQDNNENRYGFECQEESEYYPYWAPTPWKDVAIFTQDTQFCGFYKSESENVKGRGYCVDSNNDGRTGNYAAGCTSNGDTWTEGKSHGIAPPDCIELTFNRDNHLGNAVGGYPNNYNWKIPSNEDCADTGSCSCVLRIRYNISTGDVGPNGNNPDSGFIDYTMNGNNSPVQNDEIASQDDLGHELALDTTQFGRTFQDRSHTFEIRKRPTALAGKIYNLNVRGKRGNIVQAYPAVEYDFIPEILTVYTGDYIHFQWTGCDKNPAGNAGEGTDQTDRSNIVQIECPDCNYPATNDWLAKNSKLFPNAELRKRAAYLDQEKQTPSVCYTYDQLVAANPNNQNQQEQDVHNCMKLNAAPQYFDLGAIKMNTTADFHYMSSRNNNFSNRSQKGLISVTNTLPIWGIVIVVIGAAVFVCASAVGVAAFYGKSHPHSAAARLVQRFG